MSKIALSPSASGTGVYTIASPNGNTDRTLTLPDEAGTIITTAGVPASAMPAGSVIQVVSSATRTQLSTTSTSYQSTDLNVSITPTSASSKILIVGHIHLVGTVSQSQPTITLYRNTTDLLGYYGFGNIYTNSGGYGEGNVAFSFLDSPATSSSINYRIYGRNSSGAGSAYFADPARLSVITAMEIVA